MEGGCSDNEGQGSAEAARAPADADAELPPDLVEKVDARAAKERRSRANMLEVILEESFGREVLPEEAA